MCCALFRRLWNLNRQGQRPKLSKSIVAVEYSEFLGKKTYSVDLFGLNHIEKSKSRLCASSLTEWAKGRCLTTLCADQKAANRVNYHHHISTTKQIRTDITTRWSNTSQLVWRSKVEKSNSLSIINSRSCHNYLVRVYM